MNGELHLSSQPSSFPRDACCFLCFWAQLGRPHLLLRKNKSGPVSGHGKIIRLTAPQVGNRNDSTAGLELFSRRALCGGPSPRFLTQFCPTTVPHVTEETVEFQGGRCLASQDAAEAGSRPFRSNKNTHVSFLVSLENENVGFPRGTLEGNKQTYRQP